MAKKENRLNDIEMSDATLLSRVKSSETQNLVIGTGKTMQLVVTILENTVLIYFF